MNKQLVCGGEVKVREGKSFALPIPIDMTQFTYSMIQQAQMSSQDAVVRVLRCKDGKDNETFC